MDAGDATQGASFATVSQGEDVIHMMNAAGYDVMAAGNHEFDYGSERLLSNAASDCTITGQDETGLLLRESVSGSFMQVSGFAYTYDPAAESGAKVSAAELDNGAALARTDSQTALLVAANSYAATKFTGAGAKKLGELGGEDQIVMEYIQALTESGTKPLRYVSGRERIKIAGDKSPETYT